MLRDTVQRIIPLFLREQDEGIKTRLALDIGTEYVKAVYLELTETGGKILGVGRAKQEYSNMEGGAVADIDGVVNCCLEAMTQGAIIAGVKPKEVVIGIAGQFVHGMARTVERQRSRFDKPLSAKELRAHVQESQQEALTGVSKQMKERLGYQRLDVELVNSSLVNMTIDGYPVHNPLGFKGRNLEFSIFMTFAPLVHAGAMRTIAEKLDLDLIGMVAEPYAVAAGSLTDEDYEFGAVVIDVGGGSTDIALVQQRGIVATKIIPMGGRAFTKGIATNFHKSLREAEQMKLDYAEGIGAQEVREVVQTDLMIWLEAVLIGLREIYVGNRLPPRIVLCGGGSGLPGLSEVLQSKKLITTELFQREPEITLLEPENIYGVSDPKEFFRGQIDVTPKAIAYQATFMQTKHAVVGGEVSS